MSYKSFLPLISFIVCYLSIALSGKLIIQTLERIGLKQFIREEGPASHKNKQFTPTAGGIAFIMPILFIILLLIFCNPNHINWTNILLPFFILLASGFIGFADDYLKKVQKQNEGLKPKQKLIAQIILSIILSVFLNKTISNFFSIEINLNIFVFYIFIFFVLAGSMNAANLTDGLDGLASSVLGFSYLGLGFLQIIKAHQITDLSLWSFGLAGLCFGFLIINKYPAKVFMGDTGSFFLGGGLASLALLSGLEWYLVFLMLIPIWEVLSVIIQVFSCKISKKFFQKDWRPFRMTPFHHHLELCGFNENKIVLYLSFMQCLINALLLFFIFFKLI